MQPPSSQEQTGSATLEQRIAELGAVLWATGAGEPGAAWARQRSLAERHAMISAAQTTHPQLSIRQLCALFGVGRTWYYTQPTEPDSQTVALRVAIETIILAFPGASPCHQAAPA
ncbi:MAG: hypothetical protein M9890_08250 [Thermomicrobiales bacterium]|nr:hypothetical protein [Thermomicrobiales bacterium]